jgi:hypothetical protein
MIASCSYGIGHLGAAYLTRDDNELLVGPEGRLRRQHQI